MRRNQTQRAVLLVLGMALILIPLGLIAWGNGAGTSRVVTIGTPPDTTVITHPCDSGVPASKPARCQFSRVAARSLAPIPFVNVNSRPRQLTVG